jgi:hypothetical protein
MATSLATSKEHGAAIPEDHDNHSFETALPEYEGGPAPGPSPYKSLPLSFNIYYKKWFSSMYQIGEHEDQPLFTIQRHGAWGHDKPMIVLHEGADPKGPVVATVTKQGLVKHDTVIELRRPGLEGEPIREPLVSDVSMTLKNSRFTFAFDVGRGKEKTHRETFEWRISKAIEVRTLDSMAFGWKLVRLGPDQPAGKGGSRGARDVGEASDGNEVVAAWSENSGMTLSKIAKFHFLGAGATGEFGDDWALMAALSAFRLWKFTSGSISVRP